MARLIFTIDSKTLLEHIYNAEDSLMKAGITFDTSSCIDNHGKILTREWEIDESLKGANVESPKKRKFCERKQD